MPKMQRLHAPHENAIRQDEVGQRVGRMRLSYALEFLVLGLESLVNGCQHPTGWLIVQDVLAKPFEALESPKEYPSRTAPVAPLPP